MKRSGTPNKGTEYYTSYQQGSYYASEQTKTLEDSAKTYHEAEDTANRVLQQMNTQRQQIGNAHDNVWEMRQATEQAKRELIELQKKYQHKKRRLYVWIAVLALTDFLLLLRIIQCHGNFYCF